MIRCVVVDDEAGAVEIVKDYISKTPNLELVNSFLDSVKAVNYLLENPVDLVFLDIDMPNLDGLQLSDLVRNHGMQVIFCTAYSEYAAQSYEQNAVDYLLKPIAFDRFMKAVSKIKQKNDSKQSVQTIAQEKSSKLFIKSGTRIHQVDMQSIYFMKKEGHYIEFHTSSGKYISRLNMKDLLDSLPRDNFARIHRSYVVAIEKIDTIEKYSVVIHGQNIPIGDSYKDDFIKRIDYTGN
jgi:two-component system, LytTR family, response regulator